MCTVVLKVNLSFILHIKLYFPVRTNSDFLTRFQLS